MLNKSQSEVVQSNAEKLLVLAGAGTGKTTTMLARISRLIDEEKVGVQSILVLTFTNAAACEMRDRYRRSHPNQQTPTSMVKSQSPNLSSFKRIYIGSSTTNY